MTQGLKAERRPYRLKNEVQNYAWGTRGPDAFIPQLLGQAPEPGQPYAELWMGAHPKAPSRVVLPDGNTMVLPAFIEADPKGTLGTEVFDCFGGLPFLLKVLSAGQTLSIQAHPNKAQAETLHAADPQHYPDDNHKPEIAIALDGLTALMGFRPFSELNAALRAYPEIANFIGQPAQQLMATEDVSPEIQTAITGQLFRELVKRAEGNQDAMIAAIDRLVIRLGSQSRVLTDAELRFLHIQQRYGSRDVGVIAFFLLNLVKLSPGQGLYIEAGVPHAYLEGNIIECMANSDNVVRVGLTPKYRDARTLLEIVDATPGKPEILQGRTQLTDAGLHTVTYASPAREFEIRRWRLQGGTACRVEKGTGPSVILSVAGSIRLTWDSGQETLRRGDSAFLPARLESYSLNALNDSDVFQADVPPMKDGGRP